MNKLRNYFIGDYLSKTDNVFEKARIELTYNYTVFFFLLGSLFYVNLLINHLWHHIFVITFAVVSLATIPFNLKHRQNLFVAANWFMVQEFIVSIGENVLQNFRLDMASGLFPTAIALFSFFIYGRKRGFLFSLPFIIVLLISSVNSVHKFIYFPTTITEIMPETPVLFLVPFALNIYTMWAIMSARHKAEQQIQEQKSLLEIKNKDILDSIRYAKRIQTSLLPTEKYIDKNINRLQKNSSSNEPTQKS